MSRSKLGVAGATLVILGILSMERTRRLVLEVVDLFYFSGSTLSAVLPSGFSPPLELVAGGFRIRPLRVRDYRRDYEAVMASGDRLQGLMGPDDTWPEVSLSLVDNYLQLWRHEKEFARRHAFTYTVEALDEEKTLGCLYIVPSRRPEFDAEVYFWVRSGGDAGAQDQQLGKIVREWLAEKWPFVASRVVYPGRTVAWADYLDLEQTVAQK